MSKDKFDFDSESLAQQRRRRADNFKLRIEDSYVVDSDSQADDGSAEINSYSGEEAREKMAKYSKKVNKKQKKEDKKLRKAKNKKNRRYFRITWITSVLLVGVMTGLFIVSGMNDMLAVNRTEANTVTIDVPKNPDLDTVAKELKDKGAIDDINYFKMFATLTKSDKDFRQGTFELRTNMDYQAIIQYLTSNNRRTDTVSVTITEGMSVLEIAKTLEEHEVLTDRDKFLSLCSSNQFDEDFDFLKSIKNTDERYYKLEGYLYPDTYEFYKNEDPETTIYRFLNVYEMKIAQKQDVPGYDKLTTVKKMLESKQSDYTLDQIMTIASIIQAEAASDEDMYNISSILHNRLTADVDMGVSKLGLDSTKYYPYHSESDVPQSERKNYKSRYDTYEKPGLPPGPICNPGMKAIVAALNPYSTSYYFFCHDKDGNAYYASTLYEHNMNLENIQ